MHERNTDVTKLPKLVLRKIDRQLKTNGRQALQKLETSNSQIRGNLITI